MGDEAALEKFLPAVPFLTPRKFPAKLASASGPHTSHARRAASLLQEPDPLDTPLQSSSEDGFKFSRLLHCL